MTDYHEYDYFETVRRIIRVSDSEQKGEQMRKLLQIDRDYARELGRSAVEISRKGEYIAPSGNVVNIADLQAKAIASKISISPEETEFDDPEGSFHDRLIIEVHNETTLQAAYRLRGNNTMVLNFANGIHPGGGFLNGARAQEENLCRSSGLYDTLVGDEMYEVHKKRPLPDSTDWIIYSPGVPVFRDDAGNLLEEPWTMDVFTCAAPVASYFAAEDARSLLFSRIHRLLYVAREYSRDTLVLGAWGCGAFGNDPVTTAQDFATNLTQSYPGFFSHVVFAITDWSPERKMLGPFRDVMTAIPIEDTIPVGGGPDETE